MSGTYVSSFANAWEDLGEDAEVVETYSLTAVAGVKGENALLPSLISKLEVNNASVAAVTNIISLLGMQICEDSASVKERATTHTLMLAGIFVGGIPVLVRCRMAADASGVTLEVAVRSKNMAVSEMIANSVA